MNRNRIRRDFTREMNEPKTPSIDLLLRQRGWRFVAGVIAYYLVRDTLLYVVVPLCIARGLF